MARRTQRQREIARTGRNARTGIGRGGQPGLGHQLTRRVQSGQITQERAQKTAGQRGLLQKAYGSDWRSKVYGDRGYAQRTRKALAANPGSKRLQALNSQLMKLRQQRLKAAPGVIASRGAGKGGAKASRKFAMPWDSQANRESSEAGFEKTSAQAELDAQRRAQQEESGLGDSTDPYSHAAMLKRQRDIGQKTNLTAAGNHLYSGSTINQARGVSGAYDRGYQSLQAEDARQAASYERGTSNLGQQYQLGLSRIKEGAINRALERNPRPLAVRRGVPRNRRRRLPAGLTRGVGFGAVRRGR